MDLLFALWESYYSSHFQHLVADYDLVVTSYLYWMEADWGMQISKLYHRTWRQELVENLI